ncbi:MAG: tetratricopeptide repeat protein [Alphaproteobacteria bacterium]|nr:tetratricopeptide repeat protein [Alphaproteobacteria bacterium]
MSTDPGTGVQTLLDTLVSARVRLSSLRLVDLDDLRLREMEREEREAERFGDLARRVARVDVQLSMLPELERLGFVVPDERALAAAAAAEDAPTEPAAEDESAADTPVAEEAPSQSPPEEATPEEVVEQAVEEPAPEPAVEEPVVDDVTEQPQPAVEPERPAIHEESIFGDTAPLLDEEEELIDEDVAEPDTEDDPEVSLDGPELPREDTDAIDDLGRPADDWIEDEDEDEEEEEEGPVADEAVVEAVLLDDEPPVQAAPAAPAEPEEIESVEEIEDEEDDDTDREIIAQLEAEARAAEEEARQAALAEEQRRAEEAQRAETASVPGSDEPAPAPKPPLRSPFEPVPGYGSGMLAADEPVPGSEDEEDEVARLERLLQAADDEPLPTEDTEVMADDEATQLMSSADIEAALAAEEATLLMSSADVQAALARETGLSDLSDDELVPGDEGPSFDDLAEVDFDALDDDDLLLEDDEALDEVRAADQRPLQDLSANNALVDDYGQAILPTIREQRDVRPAAAIRITPDGQGQTVGGVGLDYLDEVKVALGPAEDDDGYDFADPGTGLSIEAHDADDYEDDDEPAAPVLTPDEPLTSGGPLELSDADLRVVEAIPQERLDELMTKAQGALEAGDLASAATHYSDLLDLDPANVDAFLGRGRCHLDLGDYAAAMSDFQKAEDIQPDGPEPLVAMGELFFARKDYGRAIEFFDHAIAKDASHAMARCRRGISYYYKKSYRQAFLDLQKAYTLDPEIPNIRKYVQMAIKKLERSGEG